MTAFHKQYSCSTAAERMYQIYNFINDASQDVVDFVVSAATTAVYIDGAEGDNDLTRARNNNTQSHSGYNASTVVLDSGASSSNDYYNSHTIKIIGGLHDQETKTVTDYTGASRTVTSSAWPSKNLTGTCAIDGSAVVEGTGTAFTTEVAVGDTITLDGETKEVLTITDDDTMTMDSAYSNTKSGETATLDHPSGGVEYVVSRGTYATPSSANAFGDGSFMVIEVQFNSPGGRKWQAKISRDSNTNVRVEGTPNGGFTIDTDNNGYFDGFGSNPTSGAQAACNFAPAAGDQLYISSSDQDDYDSGSAKYGWLRVIMEDVGSAYCHGFYVGGYIPFDVTNNTDPFVYLGYVPRMSDTTTSGGANFWGRSRV